MDWQKCSGIKRSYLDNFTKITDSRLCKGFSDWANSVKEGASNDFKKMWI
ncbi:putative secreted domain protein [Shigella boydii 965-58]|nr:putative secreted domain protein [Shigella boydii 965-58]